MKGPCMCGALDCRVCGPLQGSTRCGACGRLACDEHEERVCGGCGEVVTEVATNGDSLCCDENVTVCEPDAEEYEPEVEDHHDWSERMADREADR